MARSTAVRLPAGTVTFLFSDIEGSTRLARSLPPDAWAELLERHDAIVDDAVRAHDGAVVKHEGDGTFAAFVEAHDAVETAAAISRIVAAESWPAGAQVRLRFGVHTGEGRTTQDGADYLGVDVHYAARLAAAGHGRQILLSETTCRLVAGRLPSATSIASEGLRRLKDFDEPRLIHRLVVPGAADDARPLRTLGGTDLPESPTSFVGREAEVEAVASFATRTRLVTLTGPGGTGKTRLALSAADAARPAFPDGVAFVDLAPLRDPALIPRSIATAVGVPPEPGRQLLDVLADSLGSRQLLIVLDNVEQLLPQGATVVGDLVRRAPTLHVLATSREPLRVTGEQEYPVPPLARADAEALFLERARLVRPGYEPQDRDRAAISAIADAVAGLPLAIELAAARVRLLSPAAILERLRRSLDLLSAGARDVPERQRTLRATIGWSHDLLSPSERVAFRRLAVLAGTWTVEIASGVSASAPESPDDLTDALASLADKSLLRATESDDGELVFGWHVFVREFAEERLIESGERDECARRHAEVFRDLAVALGPHLLEAGAERPLAVVDRSIHDLRRAMAWALETGEAEVGLRIIGSLWRWWQLRLNLREGRDWAERLLAHPSGAPSLARVEGLAAAGGLAYWAMDYTATRAAYVERLALAEQLGDPRQLAEAHFDLAFVGVVEEDLPLLLREGERAVAGFEALGNVPGTLRARQVLVVARYLAGGYDAALALEEKNMAEMRRTQSWYRLSDGMMLVAAINRRRGDPVAALAAAREGVRTTRQRVGGSTIGAMGVIAVVEGESGDVELAARLAGAIRAIRAETGEALASVSVLHLPDPEDVIRARLSSEEADRLMAEGATLTPDEAIALALREGASA